MTSQLVIFRAFYFCCPPPPPTLDLKIKILVNSSKKNSGLMCIASPLV